MTKVTQFFLPTADPHRRHATPHNKPPYTARYSNPPSVNGQIRCTYAIVHTSLYAPHFLKYDQYEQQLYRVRVYTDMPQGKIVNVMASPYGTPPHPPPLSRHSGAFPNERQPNTPNISQ